MILAVRRPKYNPKAIAVKRLGVEMIVTYQNSHSKPDMKLSLHPAPSLISLLLWVQLVHRLYCHCHLCLCLCDDSVDIVIEGFCGQPQSSHRV
jgi:hypothetical protein